MLGSSTWQVTEISVDRVVVIPAPGAPAARMPFWHGDSMGRPLETGRALGAFVRNIGALDEKEARHTLETRYHLERRAAANLARYLAEEREATGALPTDRHVVIQTFRDEIGDWRMVLLSPFGAPVHAPWAMAAARTIRDTRGIEVDAVWSDDGFILRFPDADHPPDSEAVVVDPADVQQLVMDEVGTSALFAARFREAAGRALLLPRRRPGSRTPLWLQRRRATSLLEAALRYPTFPIVLEAYREVLQEHFDLPALREVLGEIRSRKVRLTSVETTSPSPFASSLMFDFIASYMYEVDSPPQERRAMALTVDQHLLRELLGEPELRELLDPETIAAVELELQRVTPERRARGLDGVADLLREIGPVDAEALAARVRDDDPVALAEALVEARRAIRVTIGGREHWAAAEDAARLRDALGVPLPQGVPAVFLEPVPDPLGDVVARWARTHGPFTTAEAAAGLGLPACRGVQHSRTTRNALQGHPRRISTGRRRAGMGRHRSAPPTSQTIAGDPSKRDRSRRPRSVGSLLSRLAESRVDRRRPRPPARDGPTAAGRSDPGVDPGARRPPLPAGIYPRSARCAGRHRRGRLGGPRATRQPRRPDRPIPPRPDLVAGLATRPRGARQCRPRSDPGAPRGPWGVILRELYAAAGGGDPEDALAAVWDLVWAGEVTNDTLAPLRAHLWGRARRAGGRRARLPTTASPPAGSGRWYLVSELLRDTPSATVTAAARAEALLERYGIVVRDAVLAESVPGGFAGLYPVLTAFEEAGRVRRGYFVEGRGGSQFALPGALDRLRSLDASSDSPPTALAAADPANAYGAAIPWPQHRSGRASRSAGAYVILCEGRLAAFVKRGGRTVLTFDDHDPSVVAAGLAELGRSRIPRLVVATIDGEAAASTAVGSALLGGGFTESYKGLASRRA